MDNNNNITNRVLARTKEEIDLKGLFQIIKKKIWLVVVVTILFTTLGWVYSTYFTTLMYQTSSRIIINADAEYRKTLQVIIRDSTIMEKVVHELNLDKSPEALAGQIGVQSIDSSQVVSISVIDTDPERATKIANTTAKVFKENIPNIVGFSNVQTLSDAKVPLEPINERQSRSIILGFFIGLVAGIGLIFLMNTLDQSVKSKEEIEEYLGVPVLGKITKMKKKYLKIENSKEQKIKYGGEMYGSD